MMVTDINRLTESPGPMLKHPHSGANYHEGESIITHLNYALGPDGWDWEWIDQGLDADADEVWVLGKLTARFLDHADADEGYKTTSTAKSVKGWQAVKRSKTSGKAIDVGDAYKAADTDALKRAARLLGVGLDAWAKTPPQQRQAQRPNPPVKTTPETDAAAKLTGAPPTPQKCNKKGFLIAWHMAVKGTRFDEDEAHHKFIAYHTTDAYSSLAEFLDDATHEQADELIRAITARIKHEAKSRPDPEPVAANPLADVPDDQLPF